MCSTLLAAVSEPLADNTNQSYCKGSAMRCSSVITLSVAFALVSLVTAEAKVGPAPPPRPAPASLTSNFVTGVTGYSDETAFSNATNSLVTDDFEGVASGTNGQDVALYGSYTSLAPSVYTDANGTTFTSQSISLTPGLAIEGTQYGINSNGSYGAIGADFGSAVLSSDYESLTITFAAPVNAFSLNYGSLGTAFAATQAPDLYTFTIAGLGSATEGADGLINQGTFEQAGTGFFGVTSTTPFTSITIDASKNGAGFGADNRFYDNVQFQAVPAVSAAPEPSVWALMLAGVGAMGLVLRRSKKLAGLRSKDAATA